MDIMNPKSPETRYSIQGIEEAIFNCMDATNSGEIDEEIFIINSESSETRKFYGYVDDEVDRSETEIFSREIEDGDEFNMFSTMDSSETGNFAVETEEFETGFNSFKNFDIIREPPDDHHFFKHQKDSSRVHALGQKIKQEWNLLKEKLPNSIFVRVYESRFDLMRVAIISPPNTRYHYGLFFFDIFFPRNYPFRPPKIYYHSYGFDLNPNLRPKGKVRLSILEHRYQRIMHELCACTRTQWNPKQSSILHVLYAIQGAIMCAKPYSIDESEPSKYIKKAFQLTCGIMIRVLQEPPKNFEDFVKEHFRKRADSILAKFTQEFNGIKDQPMIIDLFTDLYKSLERNGTSCVDRLCFLKSRNGNHAVEKSKNEGHMMKIARMLKNLID